MYFKYRIVGLILEGREERKPIELQSANVSTTCHHSEVKKMKPLFTIATKRLFIRNPYIFR